MRPVFVLDTNVLLNDPRALYVFSGAEIIIPQTVLIELDKLKTSRTDDQTRFHGREISRILFELSEKGKLSEGVEIGDDSVVRVGTIDSSKPIPEALKTKISDDYILALTYQLTQANPDVTLVTNDLNMLLKAQSLGVPVKHFDTEISKNKIKFIMRKIKAPRGVIVWISIFLVIVVVSFGFYLTGLFYSGTKNSNVPPEILAQLEPYQIKEYAYQQILKSKPNDVQALIGLGNLYFDVENYQAAIDKYRQALKIEPKNGDVRTDMGVAYFKLGMADMAITELRRVIIDNPNHALAHFNLGVVYWHGKGDSQNAIREFNAYLTILPDGPLAEAARHNIGQIERAAGEI
ncbi:MAG: tetratricopeptide repeat protein [Actinobacteria bacterium]|nr:tetratricopeptide repeat protein [Actinomycetota bacterium]